MLKRPDVLILNEATGSLDGAAQTAIQQALRTEMSGRGLVWAVHRASMAQDFDRILVMKSGRVVEHGTWEELNTEGSAMHELVQSE